MNRYGLQFIHRQDVLNVLRGLYQIYVTQQNQEAMYVVMTVTIMLVGREAENELVKTNAKPG